MRALVFVAVCEIRVVVPLGIDMYLLVGGLAGAIKSRKGVDKVDIPILIENTCLL